MTLYEITQTIESEMHSQPNCGTILRNDVFRINETAVAEYPAFAWVQGTHRLNGDRLSFSFVLYYVERLTEDKSNEVFAQSAGITSLTNIVKGLKARADLSVSDVSFDVFIQKFKDLTAGASCRLSISVPLSSVCAEDFTTL